MTHHRTAREYGFAVGQMQPGPMNLITDVSGVRVGHVTISRGDVQTGVTAILPHEGNLFREKLVAASHVINGFGKSMGLIQINEMGTLETPVILTNTPGIGTAADALIRYMLEHNPDIGTITGSVNPVIGECNDGYLNDIRGMHVTGEHVRQAIDNAAAVFDQGSVGAGTGMSAYGLKGGIGSARAGPVNAMWPSVIIRPPASLPPRRKRSLDLPVMLNREIYVALKIRCDFCNRPSVA